MTTMWNYILAGLFSLIMIEISHAQEFEISPAEVNSSYDDYAAAVYGEKIIFCSNRKSDLINTIVDSSDTFMTNVFESKIKDHKLSNPKLISDWRRPEFHEGPTSWSEEENRFYFTSSMKVGGKRKRDGSFQTVLGIYYVLMDEGKVHVNPRPFSWNSEGDYNVAHPAVSPDGEKLVFVSDMSGSSDLYVCYKTPSGWSRPDPMPDFINTKGREMFPSFFEDKLYFSSDGHSDSKGMDIYYSKWKDGKWHKPIRMKEPINSEFNDFGIAFEDDEHGFISSNRDEISDNLYRFSPLQPEFEDCKEIQRPTYCYLIEEEALQPNDTLPLAYEWDLGDGTVKRGLTVEHCFPDTGFYELSLNIRDTITGNLYTGVSKLELLIEKYNQPYITSSDTVKVGEEVLFTKEGTKMKDFAVDKLYWEFVGEEKMLRGDSVVWTFSEPGLQRVTLGVLSETDENGDRKKSCVYKEIVVLEGDQPEAELELIERQPVDSVETMDEFVNVFTNNLKLETDSGLIASSDSAVTSWKPVFPDSTLNQFNTKLNELITVEFLGEDDLTDTAKDDLNYLIMLLRQNPQFMLKISACEATVEESDKDDLALYKALTVQNYFELLGIPKAQLKAKGIDPDEMSEKGRTDAQSWVRLELIKPPEE